MSEYSFRFLAHTRSDFLCASNVDMESLASLLSTLTDLLDASESNRIEMIRLASPIGIPRTLTKCLLRLTSQSNEEIEALMHTHHIL